MFASVSGRDMIADFKDNEDRIDLRGFAGIAGFGKVRAQADMDVLMLAVADPDRMGTADFLLA